MIPIMIFTTIFFISAFCLFRLIVIDLKYRILPNEYVLALFILGVVFHVLFDFKILTLPDMAVGMGLGAGLLWSIRFVANWYYQDDTLGLGDVKLMGAAGVWLGPDHILLALIIGASAGVLHGLGMMVFSRIKTGQWPALSRFSLPAGPGFIVGGVIAGSILFHEYVPDYLSQHLDKVLTW